MHSASAKDETLARGVYEQLQRKEGCVVLVAVDSRGDEQKRVQLLPGVSYERAMAWLYQVLDRVDPVPEKPKLELVRDVRTPRPPARKIHPVHADDRRAYRNRLITQLSHRVRIFRD